jgi:hypothetical protein
MEVTNGNGLRGMESALRMPQGRPERGGKLAAAFGHCGSGFCECLAVLFVGQSSFCVHSLGEQIMIASVSLRFLAAFSEFWNHHCS